LRLKILKMLRTASLNSEFTGSYKKKCSYVALSLWRGDGHRNLVTRFGVIRRV